jgi:hypothetical protein
MSHIDPNKYSILSSEQLEDNLKQPGLSEAEQQFIQAELTKRWTIELLKGKKAALPLPTTKLPESKQSEPAQPELRQPELASPIAPPHEEGLSTTQTSSRDQRERRRSWVALPIIIVTAVILFVVINNNRTGSSSSGSQSSSSGSQSSSSGSQPTSIRRPTNTPNLIQDIPTKTFAGINGKARLNWNIGTSAYIANIQLTGSTGIIDVGFYSPELGINVIIRQDLTLQDYRGDWFYVGSNPRYADTGVSAAATYFPDTFKLAPSSSGGWTIVATCDAQLACASVATTPLP